MNCVLLAGGDAPQSAAIAVMLFIINIGLPTLLALLALWKKALTHGGLVLAWLLAVAICVCGGLPAFAVLAAVFIFTVAAGKISGRGRERVERALHAKTGRRDAVQIFCNVFVGTLMLVLYRIDGSRIFIFAYSGAMAASLADSMASELGVMSPRQPVDILTFRPVEKGLSGGVTPTGLLCSLLGAAVIAAISALFRPFTFAHFVCITVSGFLAALADSLMGSALQAKYRCPECGRLTEKPRHCGAGGSLERGFRAVNNDSVNFLNNITGAALAALLVHYFA